MSISAALVKELRERTGSGMMDCKKALLETNGDLEAAIELMRKAGQAKAAKKAGRTAADGLVVIEVSADGKRAAMAEVNCETDFVAKDASFQAFADTVVRSALDSDAVTVEELVQLPVDGGGTIEESRQALVAKIGENMNVRRFVRVAAQQGSIASYRHGVRIGVLVVMEGGDEPLAKDVAMHIAASNPVCVSEDQVPADLLDKERAIYMAQAAETGKPENILEKIVDGRIRKYLAEITLLGQPFVKDPDTTVAKLLAGAGARVLSFERFELGEGIEKKSENFADEVMAQVRGQ